MMSRRVLSIVGVLCALPGCGSRSAIDSQAAQAKLVAPYQSEVGKTKWARFGVNACSKPGVGGECTLLPDKTRIQIVGVTEGPLTTGGTTIYAAYFQLQLDDGRTVYTMAPLTGADDVDPAAADAECNRRGDPRIGMTAQQVEATCWGKPIRVNRTTTARSVHDQFVYGNKRYVYLTNGIVKSIQVSNSIK